MLATIFAGTARHPRLVMSGTAAVAAGSVGAQLLTSPESGVRHAIPALLSLVVLASSTLAVAAWVRPRPAAFAVDARNSAFRTLPSPGHVYNAATSALISAAQVAMQLIRPDAEQDPAFDRPSWHLLTGVLDGLSVVLVALSIVLILAVWRGIDVQLRPEGLVSRDPFGTLTVPWEALAADSLPRTGPTSTSLLLTYARPDLVRRRGLPFSRRRIRTDTVNALFLVDAVHHYLASPQHRQSIGTAAGYDALLGALFGARPA
ncbi:hypothetical protein ABZS66_36805 [Dactylosporangium sp. NPDC005572]|uniref:hypothetical protein n=1 Tax=Dactylosporangium sp. NPDC005572 TaxID=3156889 RepID=UPI0033A9030D